MTFDQVLELITSPKLRKTLADEMLTDYQKAANIHAWLNSVPPEEPVRRSRIKPKPEIENRDARPTQGDGEIG